jgi:hypothetical protein
VISEVADMIDEDSDWISLDDAVTYVAATLHCYREKALDLVHQAADNLKLNSRTTTDASPRWIVSVVAGEKILHSDGGTRIEVSHEGLLKLWPEHQKDATRPLRPEIGSNTTQRRDGPISNGIRLAIDALWPNGDRQGLRAKDRDNKILAWLEDNKRSIPANIARAVQRVLKEKGEAS